MGVAGPPVQVRNPLAAGVQTENSAFLSSALPVAGFALIEASKPLRSDQDRVPTVRGRAWRRRGLAVGRRPDQMEFLGPPLILAHQSTT